MLLLLSLFINLLLSLFLDLLLLLFDNSSQEDIKQQPTSTLINITTSTPMKHKGAQSWVQEAMMAAAAVPPLFWFTIFSEFSRLSSAAPTFFSHPRSAGSSALKCELPHCIKRVTSHHFSSSSSHSRHLLSQFLLCKGTRIIPKHVELLGLFWGQHAWRAPACVWSHSLPNRFFSIFAPFLPTAKAVVKASEESKTPRRRNLKGTRTQRRRNPRRTERKGKQPSIKLPTTKPS